MSQHDICIAEFNSLRQEIIQNRTFIKDYRSLALTATIAVLSFSFSDYASREPFICLIPILIAIPFSLLCNKCYRSIAKLGAYLYVFYGDEGFKWEKRTGDYAKRKILPNPKRIVWNFIDTEAPFICIIIICSIVTIIKCQGMSYKAEVLNFRVSVAVIIVAFAFIFLILTKSYLDKERDSFIHAWEEKKRDEESSRKPSETDKAATVESNSNGNDSIILKTFMEMAIMIVENSESKEAAVKRIRGLSIIKE